MLLGRYCVIFYIIHPYISRDIVRRSWKPTHQKSQHSEHTFCIFYNCSQYFQFCKLLVLNTVIKLMLCVKIVDYHWTFVSPDYSSLSLPGISRAEWCVQQFQLFNIIWISILDIILFSGNFLSWRICVTFYFWNPDKI